MDAIRSNELFEECDEPHMKRNTNNTLMLAYIVFIFVAVFTRHLYGLEKWNHIITAITVTSWIMVFSDVSESIADLLQYSVDETKDRLETYLYRVQHNKEINNHLDSVLVDDYGRSIGKTMKENLDGIERSVISFLNTIKKEEITITVFTFLTSFFLFIGFLGFFCILIFEPIYSTFYNKLEGMSAIAFGTILASRFARNYLEAQIQKIGKGINDLNEGMGLINDVYEREISTETVRDSR